MALTYVRTSNANPSISGSDVTVSVTIEARDGGTPILSRELSASVNSAYGGGLAAAVARVKALLQDQAEAFKAAAQLQATANGQVAGLEADIDTYLGSL